MNLPYLNLGMPGWIVFGTKNSVISCRVRTKKEAIEKARFLRNAVGFKTDLQIEKWDCSLSANQWRMWKKLGKK